MTTVPTVQARRLTPPIRFRNVARTLPPGVEWQRGYSYGVYCDERPGGHAYCDPADLEERTTGGDVVDVYPFWLTLPLACDEPILDPAELLAEQADTLETATDWGLAHELWSGEIRAANPADPAPLSLARSWSYVSAAVPTSPAQAFSVLLDAAYGGSCGGTSGRIWHIPPQLVPPLLTDTLITQVGNQYIGPMGFPVLADTGYGPVASLAPGASLEADGTHWLWLSGPVRYALGPVELTPSDEDARRYNPRRNRYEVWARRLAVVEVDPCCILGIGIPYGEASMEAHS